MPRQFVVISDKGKCTEMSLLARADMDALLENPRTHNIIGVPAYYDHDGRIWPIKDDNYIITKEI